MIGLLVMFVVLVLAGIGLSGAIRFRTRSHIVGATFSCGCALHVVMTVAIARAA